MLAIALKDLRTFSRQRISLFFTFVWPLCVAVLFGVLFGGSNRPSPKIPVAVVDEDGTAASKAFVDRLVARESFAGVRATRAEALEAVRKGQRTAAIVLRPGFGEASTRLFHGTPPQVEVFTDPSRQAERGMLEGLLMQQGAERLQSLFTDPASARPSVQKTLEDLRRDAPGRSPALESFLGQLDTFLATPDARPAEPAAGQPAGPGWEPLRIVQQDIARQRTGPNNGYDVTFPMAVLWAVFGCVMAFGTTFASERVRGTMVRLQVSPMSRGQILAGKSLAALFAIVIVEVMLIVLGVAVFGLRPSSWGLMLVAMICTGAAFVGIILLLASMATTEQGIGGMAPAIMMPLFLLGGAMVPLMVMPPWLAKLSVLSPVRWAILALEGAIWRDFGVTEMLLPCAILLAVAAVTFIVGARRSEVA
ncbi:ABC transporter permease [Luteitalea sp. TBR-22]|uniref:ABC transporter permease n=1 Tax=Luteitalea sp. TBR-22 TaxID=2802971 RepID=UPI001EF65DD4|nr:ABC transporter permease [Luteitalea sp. TBR-22]